MLRKYSKTERWLIIVTMIATIFIARCLNFSFYGLFDRSAEENLLCFCRLSDTRWVVRGGGRGGTVLFCSFAQFGAFSGGKVTRGRKEKGDNPQQALHGSCADENWNGL